MTLRTEGMRLGTEAAANVAERRDAVSSSRARVPVLIAGATVGLAAPEREKTPETDRIRQALRTAGFRLAVTAPRLDELVELCVAERPDAIVVEGAEEALASASRLREVRAAVSAVPMVVIVRSTDRRSLRKAMAAGVEGCVRDADVEEVLALTVASVIVGQLCVPASMRQPVARPAFSHREKQVLELVAQGLTNGEVAERLFLAESTVKSHLSSSFRKLGVSSRQEAAAVVLDPEQGIGTQLVSATEPAGAASAPEGVEENGVGPPAG